MYLGLDCNWKARATILVGFLELCIRAYDATHSTQSWRTGLGPMVDPTSISWWTVFFPVDSNFPLRYLPAQTFHLCISIVVLTAPIAGFAVLAACRPPH